MTRRHINRNTSDTDRQTDRQTESTRVLVEYLPSAYMFQVSGAAAGGMFMSAGYIEAARLAGRRAERSVPIGPSILRSSSPALHHKSQLQTDRQNVLCL